MVSKAMVCAVAMGAMACGGNGGAPTRALSTDARAYCSEHDRMCAYDDLDDCLDICRGADIASEEGCWFRACAVATGYCDGDVPGDPQILACADAQGWYDACGELAADCARCSSAQNIVMCDETVERGLAFDCVTLRQSLSGLTTGC